MKEENGAHQKEVKRQKRNKTLMMITMNADNNDESHGGIMFY